MPPVTTLLRELTADLRESLVTESGLYHIRYTFRNPSIGQGRGLDGVDDDQLIRAYAEGLDATRRLLVGWGWPEPPRSADGCVRVWVFRTERLGRGDCPLTIPIQHPGNRFTSELALRATLDTPRPADRLERAKVEAAHEAAHTFTHRYAPPGTRRGSIWAWFDEATAVFMEGEAFPDSAEARRFGLYWNHCPEWDLTAWGGYGGYFAAWFVRYLTDRFGRPFLHEVWSRASDHLGPVQVIETLLGARNTSFSEVFWDYCVTALVGALDPTVGACFGPRSLTETLRTPTGKAQPVPLGPLGCRYFKVAWDTATAETPIHLQMEGEGLHPGEFRAEVVAVVGGAVVHRTPLEAGTSGWAKKLSRPVEGEQYLVVGRVTSGSIPGPPRPSLTIRLTLGAAVPDSVYRKVLLAGVDLVLPRDLVEVTDYTFLDPRTIAEIRPRLSVAVTAPGEGPTVQELAAEYQARLGPEPGEGGGEWIPVRPLDLPTTPSAVALECEFQEDGAAWSERVAFVELDDGGCLQIAVTAPRDMAEAEQWFRHAVQNARTRTQTVRLRPGGNSAAPVERTLEPAPFESTEWVIGNVIVPIPSHLNGPSGVAVVATDESFGFEIPAAPVLRRRLPGDETSTESVAESGTTNEWAAAGAQLRLGDALRRVEVALTTALAGGNL